MLTLDDVLDAVAEAANHGADLKRINVTNQGTRGGLLWCYVSGHSYEIWMHPDDWEELRKQALKYVTPPIDRLWGLPVFVTDQSAPKTNSLSVRYRNQGVEHALEVFDEFGNKLGEVKGCTGFDFQADARGWGELTVRFRVADGGLDGP